MDLHQHYEKMWLKALGGYEKAEFELDHQLADPEDTRRGLTLLARPSEAVLDAIEDVLGRLAPFTKGQYCYPRSDIHLTILSIISCYPGFDAKGVPLDEYCGLIREAVSDIPPFEVTFTGLTASPSCLMVRGYPSGDGLEHLRNRLRQTFASSDLEQSIDARYRIQTAHLTILRFVNPLAELDEFLRTLHELCKIETGRSQLHELDFVANDWYQRQANRRLIERFRLG